MGGSVTYGDISGFSKVDSVINVYVILSYYIADKKNLLTVCLTCVTRVKLLTRNI